MTDFLQVERSIKKRIAEQLPEVRSIFSFGETNGLMDTNLPTPSIVVAYDGDQSIYEGRFFADRFAILQNWRVTLILPGRYQIAGIENAGNIMGEITRVLTGWIPTGAASRLHRLDSPRPEFGGNYIFYHQIFSNELLAEQTEVG